MNKSSYQSGFTAIELLVTLFVAAAFLIAAYQLFNVVVKDGGQARAESRASNVAYDYLRRYSASATDPCSTSTPLNNASITVDGLSNTAVTVAITCLPSMSSTLSKITTTITYNNPQQTATYSTYANGTGTPVAGVTDGLLSWWKFNGDANSSVGNANGTVTNATLAVGQGGVEDTAYSFNGSNSYIQFPNTSLPSTLSEVTVSFWAYNRSTSNNAILSSIPDTTSNRLNIHLPYTNLASFDFGSTTTGHIQFAYSAGWLNTWDFWTFSSSTADGMKIYRNASVLINSSASGNFVKGTKIINVGSFSTSSYFFNGLLDDMRIYNRVLTPSEVTTLYSAGAQ